MATPSGGYNVIRPRVSTTTAITVIQVKPGASSMIELTRAYGGQSSSTTSAATSLSLIRKTATATVTSQTPQKTSNGMQASTAVGGVSATGITATAEGTDDTAGPFWEEGFNLVGNGCLYLPVPEERAIVGAAAFVALKHFVAPAGNWTHNVSWLEYSW
jgi:hypothetical protein